MKATLQSLLVLATLASVFEMTAMAAPGIVLKETMSGHADTQSGRAPLKVTLQLRIDDIKAWQADPDHVVQVTGKASIDGDSFAVAGTLDMMAKAHSDELPGHYLRYRLKSLDSDTSYVIRCSKHVKDGIKQNLIAAMTVCSGTYSADGNEFPAMVRFHWENPFTLGAFLLSFRAINTSNPIESLKTKLSFFKTYLIELWASISAGAERARELVFLAPDSGSDRTRYACTFHWMPLSNGDWLGLDLVRSDDTGRMALRTFVIPNDGSAIRAWIHEAPVAEWAPFSTEALPDLDGNQPVLARGKNWIAGSADGVAFDLSVEPLAPGHAWGRLLLEFMHISVTDYTQVRFNGWVRLDGRLQSVDALGTTSIHYGDRLPQYAYLMSAGAPGLLMAAVKGDAFKIGGFLFGGHSVIYGYGADDLPSAIFEFAKFKSDSIPFEPGVRVELSDVRTFEHVLLGKKTQTGTAQAELVSRDENGTRRTPLGRVILDFRGSDYVSKLK